MSRCAGEQKRGESELCAPVTRWVPVGRTEEAGWSPVAVSEVRVGRPRHHYRGGGVARGCTYGPSGAAAEGLHQVGFGRGLLSRGGVRLRGLLSLWWSAQRLLAPEVEPGVRVRDYRRGGFGAEGLLPSGVSAEASLLRREPGFGPRDLLPRWVRQPMDLLPGWGWERRRTEWWRGTCGLAGWLPGVDCRVVVVRWPLFIARHERRRLGVGCELVGFARDELHGAGGSRGLSRRVVGEAGEAVVGVAGAAANKRLVRLFVAELSSPSGRVRLAQALVDG